MSLVNVNPLAAYSPQLIGEVMKRGAIMLVGMVIIILGATILIAGTSAGRQATSAAVKTGKTAAKIAAVIPK